MLRPNVRAERMVIVKALRWAEAHAFEEQNEGQWPCGGLRRVVKKEWRSGHNGWRTLTLKVVQ